MFGQCLLVRKIEHRLYSSPDQLGLVQNRNRDLALLALKHAWPLSDGVHAPEGGPAKRCGDPGSTQKQRVQLGCLTKDADSQHLSDNTGAIRKEACGETHKYAKTLGQLFKTKNGGCR